MEKEQEKGKFDKPLPLFIRWSIRRKIKRVTLNKGERTVSQIKGEPESHKCSTHKGVYLPYSEKQEG